MKRTEFEDFRASFVAMVVRNAIEDLHAEEPGLTDDVMARLNLLVRRAIYEGLNVLDDPERYSKSFTFNAQMIPSYWEPPSTLESVGFQVTDVELERDF